MEYGAEYDLWKSLRTKMSFLIFGVFVQRKIMKRSTKETYVS